MSRGEENSKLFATRMFFLALIAGLLISLCTPLTYFGWAWKTKQAETVALAQQIAREAQEIVINNPDMRQYNLQQMNSLVSSYQQKPEIKHIKIATNWSNSESSAGVPAPALFDIVRRVDITFHGTTLGYVEITVTAASVIMSTVLLAGIFFGLGLLVNTLIYRLPVSIVIENEKTLEIVTHKLKEKTEELAQAHHLLEGNTNALDECKSNLNNDNQLFKKLTKGN